MISRPKSVRSILSSGIPRITSSRSSEPSSAFSDIDVEPSTDPLLSERHRFESLPAQGNLIERGHALLTVEEKRPWRCLSRLGRCAFNRTGFEIDRPASVEGHERTNRKGS